MKAFRLSCAVFLTVMAADLSLAGTRLVNHTPPFTKSARDLGPVDPSESISLRFWLKLHHPEKLTRLADGLMRETSGKTAENFQRDFYPAADELNRVENYLAVQGFSVTPTDTAQRYLTVQGTAERIARVFQVKLHRFQVGRRIVRANLSDPIVDKSIAPLIKMIGGLHNNFMRSHLVHPLDLDSGAPMPSYPLNQKGGVPTFETQCFKDPQTQTFSTAGALPSATYTGNRFGSNLDQSDKLPPCGYAPQNIQTAYGMNELFDVGLNGKGQTVVLIDAFGSPTISQDASAFATVFHLPPVDLTIYQPAGTPVSGAWNSNQQGWSGETTLDVEYAHVMAPGAKIALVEALSDSYDDMLAANAYAVDHKLGNVVSNSWGGSESEVDAATFSLYREVLQSAFVQGISVHFSSGDTGDLVDTVGYADVPFPADLPYVTGVGGTSLALKADNSIQFQTGWGTNSVRITNDVASPAASAAATNAPLDPPVSLGFLFGSGGGTSRIVQKPSFQWRLTGSMRMMPDIAFLADPYTGVEVIQTVFDANGNPVPGQRNITTIGGTSLACPMFSALWAVADQAAGQSLGAAAPLLYRLPKAAIRDILPPHSGTNITGTLTDATGVNPVLALQLAAPQTYVPFLSALYDNPMAPYRWYVLSFGTDSTLTTGPGWDNVTGLGTPNGMAFVSSLVQ
jgi:subtilase family serine protease